METFINIFIPVVFCITIAGFIFGILMAVSPKLRAKFMSKQIKATKYMMDESKEDLKDIADASVEANSEAITKTVKAVKKGIKDTKFCKHCGAEIDADSKFCNSCGGEQ